MSDERWALVTAFGNGKTHVLDPDRYARTLCGLQDSFEWQWYSSHRDDVTCRRCKKRLVPVSEGTEPQ